MTTKICTKCFCEKALTAFNISNGRGLFGRQSRCRQCFRVYNATDKQKTLRAKQNYSLTSVLARQRYSCSDKCRRRVNARRKTEPQFRLSVGLRNRINHALRGVGKSSATIELLGSSIGALRIHLEKQFQLGMLWENWGQGPGTWQIDHIRPCASFDLTDPEQQRACFHFSNLQPLWYQDNIQKGSIYNGVRHHKVCQAK